MARKKRKSHAQITCESKVRYESRRTAQKALRELFSNLDWNGRDRGTLEVYKCAVCGGYHVGNYDPDAKRLERSGRRERPPPEIEDFEDE